MKSKYLWSALVVCLSITELFSMPLVMKIEQSNSAVTNVLNSHRLETCKVTNPQGADVYIEKTKKTVNLKKGTLLTVVSSEMHQGLIVVRAHQGKDVIKVEIMVDDTNCTPKL